MKVHYDNPATASEAFFEMADLIQQASLISVPKEVKSKVLFYCAFAGIFKAIHYGYFTSLTQLEKYINAIDGESIDMGIKAFICTIINEI